LRLVGEQDRQRGQQRPAQRERQQDHTVEHVVSARDEREGDQNHGKNQAGGHRASDNQPDPALLHPRRAFGLMVAVLSVVVVTIMAHPSPANANRE
jgi:hypothetical protein